jgi:hypothetical protein
VPVTARPQQTPSPWRPEAPEAPWWQSAELSPGQRHGWYHHRPSAWVSGPVGMCSRRNTPLTATPRGIKDVEVEI